MSTPNDAVVVLSRALDQAGDVLAAVHQDQLSRPTPCNDWDVARLIAHIVAAPRRFLDAVRGEISARTVTSAWREAIAMPIGTAIGG